MGFDLLGVHRLDHEHRVGAAHGGLVRLGVHDFKHLRQIEARSIGRSLRGETLDHQHDFFRLEVVHDHLIAGLAKYLDALDGVVHPDEHGVLVDHLPDVHDGIAGVHLAEIPNLRRVVQHPVVELRAVRVLLEPILRLGQLLLGGVHGLVFGVFVGEADGLLLVGGHHHAFGGLVEDALLEPLQVCVLLLLFILQPVDDLLGAVFDQLRLLHHRVVLSDGGGQHGGEHGQGDQRAEHGVLLAGHGLDQRHTLIYSIGKSAVKDFFGKSFRKMKAAPLTNAVWRTGITTPTDFG